MSAAMIPAGIWHHYKGGMYQVLGVGAHSETNEKMVVYVSLTGVTLPGPRMRIRPLSLWDDLVLWPDGVDAPRFRYIGIEIPERVELSEEDVVCSICRSPVEFIEKEMVFRHKGPTEKYFAQTFCDKYGYPVQPMVVATAPGRVTDTCTRSERHDGPCNGWPRADCDVSFGPEE